jgi:hypothetical protein
MWQLKTTAADRRHRTRSDDPDLNRVAAKPRTTDGRLGRELSLAPKHGLVHRQCLRRGNNTGIPPREHLVIPGVDFDRLTGLDHQGPIAIQFEFNSCGLQLRSIPNQKLAEIDSNIAWAGPKGFRDIASQVDRSQLQNAAPEGVSLEVCDARFTHKI